MARPVRARLRPAQRLTASGDFRRAFGRGVRLDGRLFLLVVAANRCGWPRLGLAVGRKVGGAVARNRVKRLLREVFRSAPPSGGVDLVFVPKRELARCRLAEVEREYRERVRRLAGRGIGRGSAPPPAD